MYRSNRASPWAIESFLPVFKELLSLISPYGIPRYMQIRTASDQRVGVLSLIYYDVIFVC